MNLSLREDALNLPAFFREQLRPLLPERAFLRRDRDGCLFVTNAPQFAETEALAADLQLRGFLCADIIGRLRISPGPRFLTGFGLRHDPPDHFCESLVRFRVMQPSGEAVALFSRGVQLLENADPGGVSDYLKRVRQLAAVSLRTRQGGVYACALIAHILETERSLSR